MECMPVPRVVVLNVATPLAFSCNGPRFVVPSRKVTTAPVAATLPAGGETVAVKVTLLAEIVWRQKPLPPCS